MLNYLWQGITLISQGSTAGKFVAGLGKALNAVKQTYYDLPISDPVIGIPLALVVTLGQDIVVQCLNNENYEYYLDIVKSTGLLDSVLDGAKNTGFLDGIQEVFEAGKDLVEICYNAYETYMNPISIPSNYDAITFTSENITPNYNDNSLVLNNLSEYELKSMGDYNTISVEHAAAA